MVEKRRLGTIGTSGTKGTIDRVARALAIVLLGAFVAAADEPKAPYKVTFEGSFGKDIRALLKRASTAVADQKRPPATVAILKRRIEEDRVGLQQALKAEGYYDALITAEVNDKGHPVQVIYQVRIGRRYVLSKVDVNVTGGAEGLKEKLSSPEALGLRIGNPARAGAMLAAKGKLATLLGDLGYPLSNVAEPHVVVDHAATNVRIEFEVDPGPPANFGPTTIRGNEEVAEDFIRNLIKWKEAEPYKAKLVDETRGKLRDTGLFSLVTVTATKAVDAKGDTSAVPMTITVKERKPHTIRAGISYNTDTGPGVTAAWENRNVYNHGEHLTLNLNLGTIKDYLEAVYFVPQFMHPEQTLRLRGRISYEDTNAYKNTSELAEGTINRQLSNELSAGIGLAIKSENISQEVLQLRGAFHLISLPGYVSYDTRDSKDDPTKGGLLKVHFTPFQEFTDVSLHFVKMLLEYDQHVKLAENPRLILAGRIALGSIAGANLLEIPPDDRFYAGGGGSIRGYRYQYVSPIVSKKPIGGQSLLELSGEVRVKITDRIGLVTFLDGGGAFASEFPRFSSGLRWGAGLGVRYFTPFGPVRLDVGVPLNRRKDIDDAFEVYISMGQSF